MKYLYIALILSFITSSVMVQAKGVPPGPPTLDVNVINKPEVTITNVPLLVEDIDLPARQSVFALKFVTIPSGSAFSEEGSLLTVPEGKRLVVEYINATINTGGADDKRIRVTLNLGGLFNSARFLIPPPVMTSIGTNAHTLAQPVKLYSEVGAEITVEASRGPDINGTDSVGIRIWGHLVDVDD